MKRAAPARVAAGAPLLRAQPVCARAAAAAVSCALVLPRLSQIFMTLVHTIFIGIVFSWRLQVTLVIRGPVRGALRPGPVRLGCVSRRPQAPRGVPAGHFRPGPGTGSARAGRGWHAISISSSRYMGPHGPCATVLLRVPPGVPIPHVYGRPLACTDEKKLGVHYEASFGHRGRI